MLYDCTLMEKKKTKKKIYMLHYGIHGFLLTELTVRKAFQGYVFSSEY